MFPIRRKAHVSLAVIHIKTYDNLTRYGPQQPQISIAGKDIFADWHISYTCDLPGPRIYPLPIRCKVHMVNFRVAFICWIGIGCEVYDITDRRAYGTNPRASGFYMHGRER